MGCMMNQDSIQRNLGFLNHKEIRTHYHQDGLMPGFLTRRIVDRIVLSSPIYFPYLFVADNSIILNVKEKAGCGRRNA